MFGHNTNNPMFIYTPTHIALKEKRSNFISFFPKASNDAKIISYFDGIETTEFISMIQYFVDQKINRLISFFNQVF